MSRARVHPILLAFFILSSSGLGFEEKLAHWTTAEGSDGRLVAIPPGMKAHEGPDGRIVPLENESEAIAAADGRAVGIAPERIIANGLDGRAVAVPNNWKHEIGPDGRCLAYPSSCQVKAGVDGRLVAIPRGWYSTEGPDGRIIAFPPLAKVGKGPEGRLVTIPRGWERLELDGQLLALPPGGKIRRGSDGHAIVVPPRGTGDWWLWQWTLTGVIRLPEGWGQSGSNRQYCLMRDPAESFEGTNSMMLASGTAPETGFGCFIQTCRAGAFAGKRVRMSAAVKTEDVEDWAGLWLRIDGPDEGRSIAFDNMQNRPIKGTRDWQRYEIVLEVGAEAINLVYGLVLIGKGVAWVDDVQFEIVSADTPLTRKFWNGESKHELEGPWVKDVPTNLGFER